MKIFIPSYNRPWTATTHKLLQDMSYTLVLRDEEQARLYRENPDFRKARIEIVGGGSVNDAREACRKELSDSEWCLQMDDNIRGFTMAELDFYRSVTDIGKKPSRREFNHLLNVPVSFAQLYEWVLKECADEAERRGANIVGFSPHANPWFRQKKWYDVGYIQNKMVLLRKTSLKWDQSNGHPAMEEYALCAAQHLKYGRVLINKFVHPVARHYEPGGLGPYEERLPAKIAACEDLLVRFPGFFRPGVTCRHERGAKAEPKPGELLIRPRTLEQVRAWQASMTGKTVSHTQETLPYSPPQAICKVLVMILGAGATGKTTLSRTLAGKDAQEHRVELTVTEKGVRKHVKAPYVLGSNLAIAGNLKNTSDAIGAMDALHQTVDHCWKQRDVVIVDGFRCTNKLVRWVEEHPLKPAALFVYIELSLNENLARLRGRREGNGKVEDKLPTKTFLNVLSFRERALNVWNYAEDHYKRQPVRYLEVPEGMEPEDSAKLVESVLNELQQPQQRSAAQRTTAPINPREQFIQYYVAKQRVGDVDPTHHVISDIFESRKVSKERQLWVAFLYATLYSPHRFLITWSKFPELRSADPRAFKDWERAMYGALGLDPDRIKFMRPPTLTQVFEAYKEALGDTTQEEFFSELMGPDPVASFHAITERLRSIKNVGRHTAYAWTEILIRCVKLPIQCDTIFVKEANSPRQGLLLTLGVKDSDPRAKNYAWLDEQVNVLIQEIRGRYPSITVDHHYMETVLCQFKNFANGKRKVGYYLDEQAGNFIRGALAAPELNWREIWALRSRHTLEEHLWEYRDPTHLLNSPGFLDACTHTWLKKGDNRARVEVYLKELQSFLASIAHARTPSIGAHNQEELVFA